MRGNEGMTVAVDSVDLLEDLKLWSGIIFGKSKEHSNWTRSNKTTLRHQSSRQPLKARTFCQPNKGKSLWIGNAFHTKCQVKIYLTNVWHFHVATFSCSVSSYQCLVWDDGVFGVFKETATHVWVCVITHNFTASVKYAKRKINLQIKC